MAAIATSSNDAQVAVLPLRLLMASMVHGRGRLRNRRVARQRELRLQREHERRQQRGQQAGLHSALRLAWPSVERSSPVAVLVRR